MDAHPEPCLKGGRAYKNHAAGQRIAAAIHYAENLEGPMAEVGVWRGATAWFMRRCMDRMGQEDKTLFLYDTFCGFPRLDLDKGDIDDEYRRTQFTNTSAAHVRSLFQNHERVVVREGVFPQTGVTESHLKFSFVHVDTDTYSSVKACAEWFEHRMVPGGVIIFDDYASVSCEGATLALKEWVATKPNGQFVTPHGGKALFIYDGEMPEERA